MANHPNRAKSPTDKELREFERIMSKERSPAEEARYLELQAKLMTFCAQISPEQEAHAMMRAETKMVRSCPS